MATQKHLNESFIYFETKGFLKKLGWIPVAGEPSGGSDNLPRIEIRDPDMTHKGSKGSYKIDLMSVKNKILLLTEVKISFDIADVEKLNRVCNERRSHLKDALMERLGLNIDEYKIVKSLALKNVRPDQVPPDFICFVIEEAITIIHQELFPKD